MPEPTIPLLGEPLALDLANTLAVRPDGTVLDLLDTDASFRAWLAAQGSRVTVPSGPVDREAVRALRAHVAQAVERARRGEAPATPDLVALTEAQRAAPAHRRLGWDGAAVTATPDRPGDPSDQVLAQLGEAAADLLTDPAVRRVRACEAPGCRLLFLPAHPRRRWCSPATCGNRVRVARYYQRHHRGD